jgi:cysteinyl-tRNA synthetase
MMNKIKLTNTLTRKKELFEPINSSNITMYACGPTVYDNPHVGNARTLVVFDTMFRVLNKLYDNKVVYVRNITDVDDKIIEISKKKNLSIEKITSEVTKIFHKDCKDLNCLKPTFEPKATEHISEMIEMISSLIKKKFAYENKGHVYFSVASFKNYGLLSNKNLDELKSGTRVEVSNLKKNPIDFVLWKPATDTDPGWSSPWGRGRPGWHLECSVMSEKYLGKNFDIHGGGLDLIFPHHENEIAQSCCNNSTKFFANYWIHNGFVTINKEKMSKSLGNVITISDAIKKYSAPAVRLALLSAHYSQPLDWNDNLLTNQKNTIDKWYNLYDEEINEDISEISNPLLDDLNTPGFIAKIHELYNDGCNGNKKSKNLFNSACRLIGLFNLNRSEWENLKKINSKIPETYILEKIEERKKAKNEKKFNLADKIRDDLFNKGIVIEDQKGKTVWKYK